MRTKLDQLVTAIRSPSGSNFLWLCSDRLVRIPVAIFIGGWVARYLGRADFGLLNYAMALVGMFATVTSLGIDALAVRDIIRSPSVAGKTIGTAMGLRAGASTFFALLSCVLVTVLRPDDASALGAVGLLSVGLIGQSLETGELLFQARRQMRRLVVPRTLLFLAANLVKVLLVLNGASMLTFAALTAFEQILSGGLTLYVVRRNLGSDLRLGFSVRTGVDLLSDSWPLAVGALTVAIYLKLAHLFVGGMLGDEALGIYAAATRIPESLYFLPSILASSLLPGLLNAQASGVQAYEDAKLRYLRINVLASLLTSLPIALAAPLLIDLIYGQAYAASSAIMRVHVWTLPFVFAGVARGQLLLNEKRTLHTLGFSLLGVVTSAALNPLLIPALGATGAALSAVLVYALITVCATFLTSTTRPIGWQMLQAVTSFWRIRQGQPGT